MNLHALSDPLERALNSIARNNHYIVATPGVRFLGATLAGETKADIDVCANTCRANEACGGFQFNLEMGKCQLFGDIRYSKIDPRYYSGAKTPNTIRSSQSDIYYSFEEPGISFGEMLDNMAIMNNVASVTDCERRCSELFDCASFDYESQHSQCVFYKGGQFFRRNLAVPSEQPTQTGFKVQR